MLVQSTIRETLALEAPYRLNGLHPWRDCATANNRPVITRLVIMDLLAHGFDELVGIRLLKSLGICDVNTSLFVISRATKLKA